MKNMFCAVLAFSGDFTSFVKGGTRLLVSSIFRGTHSIADSYLHFAPEENSEYHSHFGK